MTTLQDVNGIIILGLVLIGVALGSALRGLYARSAIPFLARRKEADIATMPATIRMRPADEPTRKAA